jgi:carbon storage regulator
MLVLTRKVGQKIRINDTIEVVVLDMKNGQAKIGIEAPRHVTVYREELYRDICQANQAAAATASPLGQLPQVPLPVVKAPPVQTPQ